MILPQRYNFLCHAILLLSHKVSNFSFQKLKLRNIGKKLSYQKRTLMLAKKTYQKIIPISGANIAMSLLEFFLLTNYSKLTMSLLRKNQIRSFLLQNNEIPMQISKKLAQHDLRKHCLLMLMKIEKMFLGYHL